jgi:hypothetical protein
MKKTLIFSGVLLIGTTASLGILRATNDGHSPQNDGQMSNNMMHRQTSPSADSQEKQPPGRGHPPSKDIHAIEGRVVDPEGNPVAEIEVVAAKLSGMLLGSKTDKDGYFFITGVGEGTYEVYTSEKNGPSCPTCPFYASGLPSHFSATVSVLKGQVNPNVVLEPAPKLAKLTGRVLDAETNEPAGASQIILRRVDMPDYYHKEGPDENGDFDIPVPLVPFTIEVVSEKHAQWNYVRNDLPRVPGRVDSLKLNRGETRKLEVRLRKQPS